MNIQDTRAAITGGVSGLGLAVARHLVAGGAQVALLDINDDKGAQWPCGVSSGQRSCSTDRGG